jgi:hypothetical protein
MRTPAEWERIRMTGTDLTTDEQKLRQLPYADFIAAVQRDARVEWTVSFHPVDDGTVFACVLFCPECCAQHIDRGEWATKPHRTHLCEVCGHKWRPSEYATVGVYSVSPLTVI